jgi:hypothetical protein
MFKLRTGDFFSQKGREVYIQEPSWVITDRIAKRVTTFEKKCYQRNADFVSTTEAINKFNEDSEDLEPYFKIPKLW